MYEYIDPHIICSLILAQRSQLFSENKRICGFALTSHSSNIAIYTNIHVLVISLYYFFDFQIFFNWQIFSNIKFYTLFLRHTHFFHFKHSTHNILSNYLKFYSKWLINSALIFPKFLEYFCEIFVPNFSKILTTYPKFVLIFLWIPSKFS